MRYLSEGFSYLCFFGGIALIIVAFGHCCDVTGLC